MLREEVTADDIAGVVSRWTGVPVERMLQGERDKLLRHLTFPVMPNLAQLLNRPTQTMR